MLRESKLTLIDDLVVELHATGRYRSRKDECLKALEMLADRNETLADIHRGLEDEACGRVREASVALAELRAKHKFSRKP